MNNFQLDDASKLVKVGQIIVGSLCAGLLFFLAIVLVIRGGAFSPLDTGATISLVAAVVALSAIPLGIVIPNLVTAAGLRRIGQQASTSQDSAGDHDSRPLLGLFLTKTIMGVSVLEGAALLNLVALLLEGQLFSLGLALLCLAGMSLYFPTQQRVTDWLQLQRMRAD